MPTNLTLAQLAASLVRRGLLTSADLEVADESLVAFSAVGANVVRVAGFGAVPDDATDNTSAIQAADDYAAATNDGQGSIVLFDTGEYVINSKINKSPYTTWIGIPGQYTGTSDTRYGTAIRSTHDDVAIEVAVAETVYAYAGLRSLALVGPGAASTNAVGLRFTGGVRQVFLADLYLRNFGNIGLHAVGGGEYHVRNTFIAQCGYSVHLNGVADSWFTEVTAGSGLSWNGAFGYGFWVEGSNSIFFDHCRGQVSLSYGYNILDSQRVSLTSCIVDQSDRRGVNIKNSSRVALINPMVYDNGKDTATGEGIYIEAADGEVVEDVTISGGFIYDRETHLTTTGKTSGSVVQSEGVEFSTAGTGGIRDVVLQGVSFRDCPTPLVNSAAVTDLVTANCPGVA